jgi:hypothetical protein
MYLQYQYMFMQLPACGFATRDSLARGCRLHVAWDVHVLSRVNLWQVEGRGGRGRG